MWVAFYALVGNVDVDVVLFESSPSHPYSKFFLESVARNLIVKIFAMIVTKWTMKAMRIPQGGKGEKGEEDNPPEDRRR